MYDTAGLIELVSGMHAKQMKPSWKLEELQAHAGCGRGWAKWKDQATFTEDGVVDDFLTRRERERRHIVAGLDSVDDSHAHSRHAALNDPADLVAIQQQVTIALMRLPASHKNVLFAHEHDGYSYDEVAVRLGFTKKRWSSI